MAKKFYVVWAGRETGVFTSWPYTKKLVDQFPGAKYKSFTSQAEADAAFSAGWGGARKSSATTVSVQKKSNHSNAVNPVESNKNFDVVIYCDGGCDPNPGKAASGVAVYYKGKLAELWYGLFNPYGTNNTAELNALFQSLLIAKKNIDKGRTVKILCDSQYSINCVTVWAYGWKKKGWKRKVAGDIKNLEIIQETHEFYESIVDAVEVEHVKAHTGIEGNELADRMSIYGIAQEARDFCRYSDPLDIAEILDFKAG